jgi:hypothetical protein
MNKTSIGVMLATAAAVLFASASLAASAPAKTAAKEAPVQCTVVTKCSGMNGCHKKMTYQAASAKECTDDGGTVEEE